MLKTSFPPGFSYPYEEFVGHVRAMETVRRWEYTLRFGHVGQAQTSQANNARVLEYFSDSYVDTQEALLKADLFLLIHDYVGRHKDQFSKVALTEPAEGGIVLVEPALLRAVHHVFMTAPDPGHVDPAVVVELARAFAQSV